jgi:predicted anti-sigma-YlaC factor YlaD
VLQEHQHLTTEQLSASIDKQLSVEEQSLVDEHLEQCEQCQLWLRELRATARLVHALPQPELPRSFVLSTDMLVTPETPEPSLSMAAAQAQRIPSVRRRKASRLLVAISAVSALAAMMGIVLILSGFLSFSHTVVYSAPGVAGSAAASSSANSGTSVQTPQASHVMTPREISTAMSTSLSQATANFAVQATASAVAVEQTETARSTLSAAAPPAASPDLNQSISRIALGLFLLALSCAGFVYLRLRHR